jgi:DNA-3-methyladenine glycosylase I
VNAVVKGEDGITRCAWGTSAPEYVPYHDLEWGRPVGDENRIYEKLCLEGFQSGLSWLTILRKREGFREAFASFDPEIVADFTDEDVDRLLADASIVRHRGKIMATIGNARATMQLQEQGTSLSALVWQHEPRRKRAPRAFEDLVPSTPESKELSVQLVKNGFRFVGPTTVYSAMQSLGVVNDHFARCHCRGACLEERERFTPPSD